MGNREYLMIFFGLIVLATGSVLKCLKPDPISYFNEQSCVGHGTKWFQIAGNVPCTNCCIFRNMTQLSERRVSVTDTVIKDNITKVYNFVGIRNKHSSIYHIENATNVVIMLDTDCTIYAVLYDITTNDLQVFTKGSWQKRTLLTRLEGIQKCGLPLYSYNTETACEKISSLL